MFWYLILGLVYEVSLLSVLLGLSLLLISVLADIDEGRIGEHEIEVSIPFAIRITR